MGKHYNTGNLFPADFDPQTTPDGDGWSNEIEVISGTDPCDDTALTGFVRPTILHFPALYTTEANGDPEIVTP